MKMAVKPNRRRAKGNQSELKTQKLLEKEGWRVYRVKGSTKFNKNVDIFGIFDILAVKKIFLSEAVGAKQMRRWIQVKTNKKIYGKELIPFKQFKEESCDNNDSVEIWSYINRKGFEIKYV